MYTAPHLITSKENKWIHQVVTNTERRVVLAVLCSLLNTAVKYNPLGWGVPYNHVVFPDPREILVTLCLQTLLVLLDYHSPGHYAIEPQQQQTASPHQHFSGSNFTHIQDKEKRKLAEYYEQLSEEAGSSSANLPIATNLENLSSAQASSSTPDPLITSVQPVDNAFRHYLSKLHRAQDFQFLMDGIYRILSNPMLANNTYLPGSTKQVRCHPEMMMLCWKLLEINKRFRNYLLETDRVLDILVVLLYYALEYKLNTGQVGLVRMCAFILQTISSDRNFGVKINKHFDGHSSLPANVRIAAFHGSYADFLIISIYILIATTKGALSTLYPTFISTISNVSPYVKNLSVVSSNKLISLFGSFSAPGFVLADEGNHRLVGYMLEIFNNVVQYQYSSNPNLIYAIVRAHKKFEDMNSFNLAAALVEIERMRTLKQDKQKLADQQRTDSTAPAEDASISTRGVEGNKQDSKTLHKTEHGPDIFSSTGSSAASGVRDQNGVMSEKARGKMPVDEVIAESSSAARSEHNRAESINSPRTSTSSHHRESTTTPSVGQVAVGRNRFVPTEDWVSTWFTDLPISTIMALINYLLPLVQKLCEQQSLTTDSQVLEYLRTVTLEEMLLSTSLVHVRKFQWGEAHVIWFRSLLWGQVYIYSLTQATNVFAGTAVKLFSVKQAPVQNNVALTAASVVDRVGDRFGATMTNIVQDMGNRVRAAGTVGLGGSSNS